MIRSTIAAFFTSSIAAFAQGDFITLASTTSTQNSGLYDYLLPLFQADTGIEVRVIAVGTGQALRIGRNGDADALLVHHRPSEDAFVADGYGIQRFDVMYNDFVFVGPDADPAELSAAKSVPQVMSNLSQVQPTFISRADDSGTHKREQSLWEAAEISPSGDWYREIGAGMGAALNMAAAIDAYTLSDRGTWLSFGNKGTLKMVYAGDTDLRNPYGLIVVNPEKFPHAKADLANKFAEWMISDRGQTAIGDLRVEGKQLFCPNAQPEKQAKVVCPAK